MAKKFKTMKASLITGILLIGVIAAFVPSSSAAIFKLQGNITASIGGPDRIVTPNGEQLRIPVTIGYAISGVGTDIVYFAGQKVRIKVEVVEMPEWASISVPIPEILLDISTSFLYDTINIGIDVNENAPAMASDNIKILITADELKGLGGGVSKVTYGPIRIDFKPQFIPILSVNVKNSNYQEISPMANAEFDIELENLGNGKTEVVFEVLNLPSGWTISVPNIKTLGTKAFGDDPTGNVKLSIQPPRGFGYHDDKQTIQIKVIARYYSSGSVNEREYPLDVTVQSRGFSIIGIEVPLILILLIVLFIVAVVFLFKKIKKKN